MKSVESKAKGQQGDSAHKTSGQWQAVLEHRVVLGRTFAGRRKREFMVDGLRRLTGHPGMTEKSLLRTHTLCIWKAKFHVAVMENN